MTSCCWPAMASGMSCPIRCVCVPAAGQRWPLGCHVQSEVYNLRCNMSSSTERTDRYYRRPSAFRRIT
eukprot:1156227-Pelagomonas_calceolata.AAC.9